SPHAYNEEMRSLMYGWMTRWLKGEGEGKPIPEPKHEVEKPEDLACFPDETRPKGYLLLPEFAARQALSLLAKFSERKPDHAEDWESTAVHLRTQLKKVLGDWPKLPQPRAAFGKVETANDVVTTPLALTPEAGLPLLAVLKNKQGVKGK